MTVRWAGLVAVTAGVSTLLASDATALSYVVEWAKVATKSEIAAVYPARALQADVEGRVALSCWATTSGDMKDCDVVSETPTGWGFGAAALMISDKFKLKHVPTGSGAPKRFRLPIHFTLPEPDAAERPTLGR